MRTKSLALRLGIVFGCFLGQGVAWNQPAYGDCESDRSDAFSDADSQYTSTFWSWYFGEPVSCQQECEGVCSYLIEFTELQHCIAICTNSCTDSRYAAYVSAQDALMEVASRTCPFYLDECAAARARRDGCVANFNAYMANPVYDENSNIDSNWAGFVLGAYGACLKASGVSNCE